MDAQVTMFRDLPVGTRFTWACETGTEIYTKTSDQNCVADYTPEVIDEPYSVTQTVRIVTKVKTEVVHLHYHYQANSGLEKYAQQTSRTDRRTGRMAQTTRTRCNRRVRFDKVKLTYLPVKVTCPDCLKSMELIRL